MVECFHVRELPRILIQITNVARWTREHQDLLVNEYYVSQPALEEYMRTNYEDNRTRRQMLYRLSKASTVEIENHQERDVEYKSSAKDEEIRTMLKPYYEKLPWDSRLPLQAIFEMYAHHLSSYYHETKGTIICHVINILREKGEQNIDDLLEAFPPGSIKGDKRITLAHMIKSASTGTLDFFVRTPNGNYDLTPKYK